MNYYPAFLDLSGKKAIVVGGGSVAERKVMMLLRSGASVTVISPNITLRLRKARSEGRIAHRARQYRSGDLRGSFLVVAATDNKAVNTRISQDAPALVNVVDVPSECNFIAPSVIQRGPLLLAISTSGVSPAFSRAVRLELQGLYGSEVAGYLTFLREIRSRALADIAERGVREKFLKGLGDEKIIQALREKGLPAVKKSVLAQFRSIVKCKRTAPQ